MQPHRRSRQIEFLVEIPFQVDDAVLAEAGHEITRSRVECNEPVTGRHVKNAFLLAVGPIRQAAAGELTRRSLTTCALVLAVHPQQFTCCCVQRDHGAAGATGRIEPPVDHQRRRLQLEFGTGPEAVGPETPGDLELAEVLGGDLVER
jgi:hypothetical protein